MNPNISLGLCTQSIDVKVVNFFDKSYNFSEGAFVKYLTTAPTSHVKFFFWQRWIYIVSTLRALSNNWMFPYFDTINFNKK